MGRRIRRATSCIKESESGDDEMDVIWYAIEIKLSGNCGSALYLQGTTTFRLHLLFDGGQKKLQMHEALRVAEVAADVEPVSAPQLSNAWGMTVRIAI